MFQYNFLTEVYRLRFDNSPPNGLGVYQLTSLKENLNIKELFVLQISYIN